jgi:phosphoglycolate phosphatase
MTSLVVAVSHVLRAVIFDLDGVLMKFKIDSLRIKGEVISYLEAKGLAPNLLKPTEPFSTIKDRTRSIFSSQGRSNDWIESVIREAEAIPIRHEVEAAHVAETLPGARETLSALRDRGLVLAIFTYNNSFAVEIALARNGIKEYFDLVAARDSVPRPKPNPLHLKFNLSSLKVGRDEAIVVGDSEMDIKPSKELGVRVVAISTGIRDAEYLRDLSPDYLIGSLMELEPIIDSLRVT